MRTVLIPFLQDKGQSILRRLTGDALAPALSAVVTTVPKPGLAEAIRKRKGTVFKREKGFFKPGNDL